MKFAVAMVGVLLALPQFAAADERPLQVVAAMMEINAKPDKVWGIVKDFDGLQNWHPAAPQQQPGWRHSQQWESPARHRPGIPRTGPR